MITIFNRVSLCVLPGKESFNRVAGVLKENNIKFKFDVSNQMGTGRMNVKSGDRSSTIEDNYQRIFEIFVHKRDYEKARFLTGM